LRPRGANRRPAVGSSHQPRHRRRRRSGQAALADRACPRMGPTTTQHSCPTGSFARSAGLAGQRGGVAAAIWRSDTDDCVRPAGKTSLRSVLTTAAKIVLTGSL
jgi:hypothetical protein